MSRVVLAMSGGVDSSVSAHLLKQAGHDVIGVFMRHGEQSPALCSSGEDKSAAANSPLPIVSPHKPPSPHKQGCCTAADAEDARRVADKLDIPFYALNLEEDFSRIMDYFVDEYTAARTPNPCVVCNIWLKFGKLFDYADSVDAQFVATGHYARLAASEGERPVLLRGLDQRKDQSYVLFGVEPRYLSRMLLPVGGYEKPEIRRLAERIGLRVADKRDSQEICFVTTGKYDQFVRERRGDVDTAGELVTTDGTVIGRHDGIESFTIGQRKGLGIAFGEPRFVVRIEADTRRVVIGEKEDLARTELTASGANWLVDPGNGPRRCSAQIRYNSRAVPATFERLPEKRLRIRFDEPCYGVAPGQAVVCYDGPQVLGGGWIE